MHTPLRRSLAATVLALLCAPSLADSTVEKEFAFSSDGRLKVINVQGKVDVRGWSQDRVRLVAELEGDPDSLVITQDETHAEIRVEVDKRWFGAGSDAFEADLTLDVPEGVRLEISSVSADVSVDNHAGDQRVQSVSGDIEVNGRSADADLESVSGDIDLRGNNATGRFRISAVSGDADVSDVNGDVHVSTISGDTRLLTETLEEAKLESVSGRLRLRGHLVDGARLRAGSVSGEVLLALCKRENVEFDLESFSGDIVDRVTRKRPKDEGWGPGAKLRFSEGSGSVRVSVNTMSGDIEIRDCG